MNKKFNKVVAAIMVIPFIMQSAHAYVGASKTDIMKKEKYSALRTTLTTMGSSIGIEELDITTGPSIELHNINPEGNLVPNGGFETVVPTSNAYWKDKEAPQYWDNLWIATAKNQKLSTDTEVFSEGAQSIRVDNTNKDARTFITNGNITVHPSKSYILSLNMKTENIRDGWGSGGAYFRVQNGNGSEYYKKSINIKDTNDWETYYMPITDLPSNMTKMKIEIAFETGIGTAWFDNLVLQEFSLNETNTTLNVGEIFHLESSLNPMTDNDMDLAPAWTSSNPDIVSVDEDGVITALKVGAATITAKTSEGLSASCTVMVDDPALKEQYGLLRQKWSNRLTGNNVEDISDPDYQNWFHTITEDAQEVWDSMSKLQDGATDNRDELWAGLNSGSKSAGITSTAKNLRTMAVAYAAHNSSLYQNQALKEDIIAGMEWLYKNRYNENKIKQGTTNTILYDNWWDWAIGAPQALGDTIILMYEELTPDQIEKQVKTFNRFNPSPYRVPSLYNGIDMEAANLLDTSLVSTLKGLIGESNEAILEATEAIGTTLPYVTSGNGFYIDGSFIDHTNIPYTGGYGSAVMSGIEKVLFIVSNSPWETNDPQINHIYHWILEGFLPLYYKGAMMDMVSGRGVSRETSNDHAKGKNLLVHMLNLSKVAPEEEKREIQRWVKANMVNDNQCDFLADRAIADIDTIKELLADNSISGEWDKTQNKIWGSMDRAVHHRPGFSVGISMFSSRVGNFEYGNGENKKGYHASDGMVYLYNDHNQFSDSYWPTADMMRLPGTTTDRSKGTVKDWYAYTSNRDWVGGSAIHNLYGSVGMNFKMEKTALEGKKSWFLFDDEVVALGAGIKSTDSGLVETIVENRKIKDAGTNKLIINGQDEVDSLGASETIQDVQWAFLEGNTSAGTDSIGYYFPEETQVKALRESRTGSWKDINNGGSSTPITKNYLSLAIEHGNNPVDASYSYVLLPNKAIDEVERYSQDSDITILSNTEKVQAVRENKLAIVGMNFWEADKVEYVEAENAASITMEEGVDTLTLGISDPTHKGSEIIINLDKQEYEVISKDSTVTVGNMDEKIQIKVDVENTAGKTHNLELKYAVPRPEVKVEGVEISERVGMLKEGDTHQLEATVLPEKATNKEVTWDSSDDTVVAVDENGLLTAKAAGVATITVTTVDGGKVASCEITVEELEKPIEPEEPGEPEEPIEPEEPEEPEQPIEPEEPTEPEKPSKPEGSGNKPGSSNPINDSVEEAWKALENTVKKDIEQNFNNELSYTVLAKDLTIEKLKDLTNNQLTEKQLEEIQKNPSLLRELGIELVVLEIKEREEEEFNDVPTTHWAYNTIKELAKKGIVVGDGVDFMPKQALVAADAFTFLDRILLLNNVTKATLPKTTLDKYITDKEHWSYYSMLSVGSKISESTLDAVTRLGSQPMTRELLAQVLFEITGGKFAQSTKTLEFVDATQSNYKQAIDYCVATGLLRGTSENTMSPSKELTRAEIVAVLERLDIALKD